jgi:hypothetical protein
VISKFHRGVNEKPRSSRMLRSVDLQSVTDVSGQPIAPISKSRAVPENCLTAWSLKMTAIRYPATSVTNRNLRCVTFENRENFRVPVFQTRTTFCSVAHKRRTSRNPSTLYVSPRCHSKHFYGTCVHVKTVSTISCSYSCFTAFLSLFMALAQANIIMTFKSLLHE